MYVCGKLFDSFGVVLTGTLCGVCVCVLELCRRIRKRLRDGRLMSASLAHGSPSVYICWAYLLPSAKTRLGHTVCVHVCENSSAVGRSSGE